MTSGELTLAETRVSYKYVKIKIWYSYKNRVQYWVQEWETKEIEQIPRWQLNLHKSMGEKIKWLVHGVGKISDVSQKNLDFTAHHRPEIS